MNIRKKNKGVFIKHTSCPLCGSSDANAIYSDGTSFCFSCRTYQRNHGEAGDAMMQYTTPRVSSLIEDIKYIDLDVRGLRKETCERFGYGVATHRGRAVQVAAYTDNSGRVVAQKIRTKDKDFYILGDGFKSACLFGQTLAGNGGKSLIITEGEIDALSVYQVLCGRFPVVSLKSGAGVNGGAKKVARELAQHIDFLLKYEKIYLFFDSDEPGRQSAEAAAAILPPGRAYIVVLPAGYKDANEMLVAGETHALAASIWGSKQWRPDGIINLTDEKVIKKALTLPTMGIKYPWKGVNDKVFGFHPTQIHVIGAGSGTGKSVVCAEICVSLRKQGVRVGYIALEECVGVTAQRLAGIMVNKPIYIPGNHDVTEDEIIKALHSLNGDDGGIYLYDHFGSLDIDVLFSRLRYMRSHLGVDVIILDHLSIVISGNDDQDERKMIDIMMTNLRSLTQETGLIMVIVTHLSRAGHGSRSYEQGAEVSAAAFRGSGAIAQLADVCIGLERNQQAEEEDEKNTLRVRVIKSRLGGRTGEACLLRYSHETGRLIDEEFSEWFKEVQKQADY